jgi:hypothetical protein
MLKTTSRNGRSGGLGPQQVIAADRDDIVDELIRGDLAGSRVALWVGTVDDHMVKATNHAANLAIG